MQWCISLPISTIYILWWYLHEADKSLLNPFPSPVNVYQIDIEGLLSSSSSLIIGCSFHVHLCGCTSGLLRVYFPCHLGNHNHFRGCIMVGVCFFSFIFSQMMTWITESFSCIFSLGLPRTHQGESALNFTWEIRKILTTRHSQDSNPEPSSWI